jgi:hypothetical protein
VKKIIALATAVVALAIPATALAAPSYSGAQHGAFANVNSNFGWLGQEYQGAPEYHNGAVGQEIGATGYNNSNVVNP